jgi:hypothetical protein
LQAEAETKRSPKVPHKRRFGGAGNVSVPMFLHQWYSLGQKVEDKAADVFKAKGKFVAKHPFVWICLFCVVAAVCAIGLSRIEVRSMWKVRAGLCC